MNSMKDYEKAKMYFMKGIEIEPDLTCNYDGLATLMMNHLKDYNESQKWYLKCLKINESEDVANASYGYLLYLMGDYESSMKYVQRELELTKDKHIWGYFYLGLLYKVSGNDEKSEDSLMKAVEIMKSEPSEPQQIIRKSVVKLRSNDEARQGYYTRFLNVASV